jgi:hypothetical protein
VEFIKDEDLSCWETEVIFKERPIILTIVDDYPLNECESIAVQILTKVEEAWQQIEDNLIRSLHELYNDGWRNPEFEPNKLDTNQF